MGDSRGPDELLINMNGHVGSTASSGLKIMIVGGGIGGFSAAIALRQQGHDVEVFEQSRLANEIGAAIHMVPNAMGVLRQFGVDPTDSGAIPLIQTRFFTAASELLRTDEIAKEAGRWQNPWLQAHRAHLHSQLKKTATSASGQGTPVALHTSSRISSVAVDTATVTLEDGTTHTADVIIGADGVQSNTRKAIMPDAPQAHKGPHNAIRFIIPRQTVLDDPETAHFAQVHGSMDMWYGPDRKIVLYPTTYNELLNFVCIHPARLSDTSYDYNKSVSMEVLLDIYKNFDPKILKMLSKADVDTLKVYPLFDMAQLPTFVRGRLALIGEAAHPFTPHLAQGGAQAIEDAASLGVMLGRGITPAEVPQRLELYNKARYTRASTIQNYSRIVGGDGTADTEQAGDEEHSNERFKIHEVIEYGFSHDEIHSSTQLLREYLWAQQPVIWRQPIGFGPMPGPRQNALGLPYSSSSLNQSPMTIASIKFKTSATLLQNLFPNKSYSFGVNDTVVSARLSVETLHNMAWLGGGGYDLVALYIDGVRYTGKDGTILHVTYCPVMFENLTDPILSGREELGVPKVFSGIDVSRTAEGCKVKVSWRGTTWAELSWDGLQEEVKEAQDENWNNDGMLVHKYIPATGIEQRGNADAQYDVLIPKYGQTVGDATRTTRKAVHSKFGIYDLGPDKLPTLHHIIARLAELPVFEILEATVSEMQGVNDLSGARIL